MRILKKIIPQKIRKKLKSLLLVKEKYDPKGMNHYPREKKPTYQKYFRESKDEIFQGNVPERYHYINSLIPGEKVLEIGSADGTQSLLLSQSKEYVVGIELMEYYYEISLELKKSWKNIGKNVSNCTFYNKDALEAKDFLKDIDTILMSRVVYHLRENINPVFESFRESKIENIVLVGCPRREKNWINGGETGDSMGQYAYYASQTGMEELLKSFGYEIIQSRPSLENERDPIVIGKRV